MLLFDDFENLIGDASPGADDFRRGQQGSKVFVDRTLETKKLPVIWTQQCDRQCRPRDPAADEFRAAHETAIGMRGAGRAHDSSATPCPALHQSSPDILPKHSSCAGA